MNILKRNALFSLTVVTALSLFGCASQQSAETKPPANSATTQPAAAKQSNPPAQPNPAPEQIAATQQSALAKEPELEISLPANAASAAVGTKITVPITVSSKTDKEIFSYSLAIMFDPEVLQPAEVPVVANGTMSEGFMVAEDIKTAGRLGIAAASSNKTIKANGTLLNTYFKVIGKSKAGSNLKIEQAKFQDSSGKPINVTAAIKQ